MADPLVTIADARAYGYCVAGIRCYLAASGLDLRTFIKQGYPASVMEATGPQGAILADIVRARHG